MNKENIQLVRLKDYDSIDALMSEQHEDLEGKPNGIAILFDSSPSSKIGIQTGLLRAAIDNYSSRVKSLDTITQFSPDGEIDGDLKDFLYTYMNVTTHVLNSYSVRQSGANMQSFEEFDRLELKMKLLDLANRL